MKRYEIYEHLGIDEPPLNQGFQKIKKGHKVFKTYNRDKNKRRVKVNPTTWIYTDKETDEEAIEAFNKKYYGE